MPTLLPTPLIAFGCRLLEAANLTPESAEIVARHLVDANLCGHDSHGIMRLPQYVQFVREGKYQARAELTVIHETPAVLAADANWGLGQVQCHHLLERLIPKAKSLGVAVGTLRNCGHAGRLGAYAEAAAEHRFALFATVNSHGAGRRVAPPGGMEGRISTNPICMGAPTKTEPVVLDFGTSIVAEGKVRVHYQKQESVPTDWLIDHNGQPTTNPAVLYEEPRGALRPFGGNQAYKGFGLGLLLDMFAGGLSAGRCSNPGDPLGGIGNALVFVLFNPDCLGGGDQFVQQTSDLSDYVRSCPTSPGVERITLPGDPERISRANRMQTGINIPDGTWSLIQKEAEKHGVPLPA